MIFNLIFIAMILSAFGSRRLIPYYICLFLITLIFVSRTIYPYAISSDASYSLKSVQQWVSGATSSINTLSVVDPNDLSKNASAWIAWWAPGMSFAFTPLAAIGLPLGNASLLTAYLLFLSGSIGWLRVADKLEVVYPVKIITALTLPLLALGDATRYVAYALMVGEIVPYAITSWLILYSLSFTSFVQKSQSKFLDILGKLSFLSILLGFVYWLKYSAFATAAGILVYLVILFLTYKVDKPWLLQRLGLASVSVVLTIFPIFLMNRLNSSFTDDTGGIGAKIDQITNNFGFLPRLLISALGYPGLALFQAEDWLTDLSHYRLNNLLGLESADDKSLVLSVLGIPGTILILWLIFKAKTTVSKSIFVFTLAILIVPISMLFYTSYKINYNFFADFFAGIRLIMPGFILVQIVLTNIAYIKIIPRLKKDQKLLPRLVGIGLIGLFFVIPNLFVVGLYSKNYYVGKFDAIEYVTTHNQLYQPALSKTSALSVKKLLDSVTTSKNDVVLLYEGMMTGAWIDIQQRILPLSWQSADPAPAKTEGGKLISGSQFSLNSGFKYLSTDSLRLIAVIPKYNTIPRDSPNNVFQTLKSKVPQVKTWIAVPTNSDVNVEIWYGDIEIK
jgi:hypothetical protein